MDEDASITRQIWDGKVPVCFTLAQEDLLCEDRVPSPIYTLLPRVSYLPLVTDRILRQLIDYTSFGNNSTDKQLVSTPRSSATTTAGPTTEVGVDISAGDSASLATVMTGPKASVSIPTRCAESLEQVIWFECANQPLKWHYPIGLLFDIYSGGSDIPWKIIVHFSNYPLDVILSPPVNREAIGTLFMSTVKEADALKHRSHAINQMQPHDHRQLWTGLMNYQFDQFWAVNRRLMETGFRTESSNTGDGTGSDLQPDSQSPQQSLGTSSRLSAFRLIPCRLYQSNRLSGSSTFGYIQRRIQPFSCDDSGGGGNGEQHLTTMADAVRTLLSLPTQLQTKPDTVDDPFMDHLFLLHGICIPPDTPIQWMSEHLTYPDNFLHIVAWPRSQLTIQQPKPIP